MLEFQRLARLKRKLVAATAAILLAGSAGTYVLFFDETGAQQEYANLGKGKNVRVIDGDTLYGPKIPGKPQLKVRLAHIDAPEKSQKCLDAEDNEYACGREATTYLEQLIAGRTVACIVSEKDRYGRSVADCYAFEDDGTRDKWSLNRRMVMQGWAYSYDAYSDAYASDENDAQRYGKGMFRPGYFSIEPWNYRRPRFMRVSPTKSCDVKGNVEADGRKVYYEKGDAGYSTVEVNVRENGEIWFCNAKAAERAGFAAAE